jgi:hypothetical protein
MEGATRRALGNRGGQEALGPALGDSAWAVAWFPLYYSLSGLSPSWGLRQEEVF